VNHEVDMIAKYVERLLVPPDRGVEPVETAHPDDRPERQGR
jgi:hypothetical protein